MPAAGTAGLEGGTAGWSGSWTPFLWSQWARSHRTGQESDRIFYFPPAKKKIKIPTSTGSIWPPRDLSPQHCHTSKFQGPLSCNRERKHKNKPCVCLQEQLSLWSLFHLSLSHSSPYSWPKGVSMPALLHGMSKKGKKKKISCWLMRWPELQELSISLDSLLQWGYRKKRLSLTEVDNSFRTGLLNEALLGFQGRWKSHQGEKNYHFLTRKQSMDSPADYHLHFMSRLTTITFCNILLSFPHKWPMSQTSLSPFHHRSTQLAKKASLHRGRIRRTGVRKEGEDRLEGEKKGGESPGTVGWNAAWHGCSRC